MANNQPVNYDPEIEEAFIANLAKYPTPRQAAEAAGYSTLYSKGIMTHKTKSKRFMDKLRAYYNGNAAMLLPNIIRAEAKAVELVNQDVSLLPKYRQTLKELKQSAGVLQQEAVIQNTISFTSIRSFVQQLEDSHNIQDAEVIGE